MSFLMRQVAHCDVCGHEWIVVTDKIPTHCAKCKSRKWNQAGPVAADNARHAEEGISPRQPKATKHALTCKCLMCKPPK